MVRTHHALLPPPPGNGPHTHTLPAFSQETCFSCEISVRDDTACPPHLRRTRSQIALLVGNAPARLNYSKTAHSRFAASADPVPPPLFPTQAPPRSSLPPRLVCPGSTITPNRPVSPNPALSPQLLSRTLFNTLSSYSHCDWERAQKNDILSDAASRYIQLDGLKPLPPSICDHLPSHSQPDPRDIMDLTTKESLVLGNDDILYRQAPGRPSRKPFDVPIFIDVPLLVRPWIMHACHANASCHLRIMCALEKLERFFWWVEMVACTMCWV